MSKLVSIFFIWFLLNSSVNATLSLKASEKFLIDPFVNLVYEMEVAIICGLATYPVSKGFELEKKQMISTFELSTEMVVTKSTLARKLADLEWQNRGLGGFKGWCAKEGVNNAKRFILFFEQHDQ